MKCAIMISAGVLICCVLLYLFLIMPRIWGRPDTAPFEGWLYAHRGLHDNQGPAPENSLAAFAKAIQSGFGMELDVQLTKDRVPVVFHDFKLERICGVPGKVSDYTWEQLKQFSLCGSAERIPRLAEVLELVGGRVPMIIEYKSDNLDISVCSVADELLQAYEGPYCIESFNPLVLAWYRKHRREVLRGQLSEKLFSEGEKTPLYFLLENLLFNFYARPDFIAYNHRHYNNLSRTLATKLYGNISVAFTIKSEEELAGAAGHFDWFIFDSFVPEMHIPDRTEYGKMDKSVI